MTPFLNIQDIIPAQIDFDDLSYSLSPIPAVGIDAGLKESIARHSILHSPIVREAAPESYLIVAGRKRLLAARSLDRKNEIACLVVPRQVPEIDVFHLLLAEIQLTRQLTAVEKAIFLKKTAAFLEERQIEKEFFPPLDLKPGPAAMKHALMLLELEEPIMQAIHQEHISETVGRGLASLPSPDRMALFEIISMLKLSFNYQKKLLAICSELATRYSTSIASLLSNGEVQKILAHKGANPPQKTKNLMTWLLRRQMPRTSEAEDEFNRFVADMHLPENVSVAHTPFFEDDNLILSVTFRNRKSLQDTWEKIRHATVGNDN